MGLLLEMCLLYVWSSDFILLFFYFIFILLFFYSFSASSSFFTAVSEFIS